MFLFYLLIAVMPLEQHWFWRQELLGSFTVVKALGVACMLLALGRIILGHFSPRVLSCAPARWYLALVAIQCGSYFIHGDDRSVDISAYTHVAAILSLFLVTLTFADSPFRLHRTALAAICAIGFASLYTIRGQQLSITVGSRPSGIFEDANYYALIVGFWIPLAFLWTFARHPLWERLLSFGCLASMLLGSTFAASRGGFLGLVASLLFLIWHSRRRLRNFVVVTTLTVPLLLYAPSSPLQRFAHPSYGDQSAQDARWTAWQAAMRMIQAHPLTGIGLGNFKPLMERYRDPNSSIVSVAHNTYLETAAELGIPGLIVHLGLLCATLLTLGRIRRQTKTPGSRHFCNLALGLQAGLVSYLVSSFFVSTWWQEMVWLPVFLTISLHCLTKRAASFSGFRRDIRVVDAQSPGHGNKPEIEPMGSPLAQY
jgi:O-antigen ligase